MICVKIGLKPKNNKPINCNYSHYLRSLCCNCIGKEKNEHCNFFMMQQNDENNYSKNNNAITFSDLECSSIEQNENSITFKDEVKWYINCMSYERVLKLVQNLYKLDCITIEEAEFEILRVEAVNVDI